MRGLVAIYTDYFPSVVVARVIDGIREGKSTLPWQTLIWKCVIILSILITMFFCTPFLCGGGGGYLVLPWSSLPLPAPLSEEFRWGRCAGQCGCHCLGPCDHHHLSLSLSLLLILEDWQVSLWGCPDHSCSRNLGLNFEWWLFCIWSQLAAIHHTKNVATFGHLVKAALLFWIVSRMLITS